MPPSSLSLALIQMKVDGGHPQDNLARAGKFIAQAAQDGAQWIVLPEALNLGWTHSSALTQAETIPDGPSYLALQEAARQHQVHLCAGLIERSADHIYNSAVLLDSQGQLLLLHRKINELSLAHNLYSLGDRLGVASTSWGRVGVMICADAFAEGQPISRTLARMGAAFILSPSAWAVPAHHDNSQDPYGQLWLDHYQPVARDFKIWIAGVSNVGWLTDGPWQGRKCIGCSLVVGPDGHPHLKGPYGPDAETILHLQIQLAPRPAQGDQWDSNPPGQALD